MANKIIGRTDVSGAMNLGSVTSNSKRPVLLVGEGVDETKEVIFKIRGTSDATAHFGKDSPCTSIVKALILNGVRSVHGICVGDVGTLNEVTKTRKVELTVAADEDGNPTTDNADRTDGYTVIDDVDSYSGETTTVEIDEEYTDTELVGGAYASKAEAYEAALRQSLTDSEVMIVILDTTDKDLHSVVKDHLFEAENADIYRYAVVGVPAEVTNSNDVMDLAASINGDRMFIAFPNVVDDNNITLDGTLTAAGIASVLNTQTDDPALPTNGIEIAGFGGVSTRLTEEDMNKLADTGVTALYYENGMPTIWRVVTTAQRIGDEEDAPHSIWHDATTRLIADDVLGSVLAKLKANYKRTKNVTRVLDSIRTDIIGVLDNKLALEIIHEYDPALVTVSKDPKDNYGALADYEYKVVCPLYTITVTQHVKI